MKKSVLSVLVIGLLVACQQKPKQLEAKAYQTSAAGDKMTLVATSELEPEVELIINPEVEFQTILGFGGAFTESSAYLLNQMSKGLAHRNSTSLFRTGRCELQFYAYSHEQLRFFIGPILLCTGGGRYGIGPLCD
jgi:O-glycosyl hydrolase